MKKVLLSLIFIICALSQYGQTISLTFQAKDSLTQDWLTIDSVNILNLEENCDTTLYNPVTALILDSVWYVGVEEPLSLNNESFLVTQNMPNPFRGTTTVRIYLKNDGELNLAVYDIQGENLSQCNNRFSKGWHQFAVSTTGNRMLFLKVSDNNDIKTIKMLSSGSGTGEVRISYMGLPDQGNKMIKSFPVLSGFIFYLGDPLLYTAYVDGYYESILYDNPVSSESYTFAMLPVETVTIPEVSTAPVTNITPSSATSGGDVISDGGAPVTERGICYSLEPEPTIADPRTIDGSGTGSFVSHLEALSYNTPYYIRAYAINSIGVAYGEELTFTTLNATLPEVTTSPVTSITSTTANSGGIVTSDGGDFVYAKGVCWNTSPNPTISDPHTLDGGGLGSFISFLSGLTPNTPYYIRAYATNNVGTVYGNELNFTTLEASIPTVTTSPVTDITATTATSGGNVTSDGGAAVTARGVCWSTSPDPALAGDHTTDGTGMGTFVSNLTGLMPETPYYIRAYATNSVGTAYGNELTFTTPDNSFTCGMEVTYEGQNYSTVLIGAQCWFQENLNVGTMIAGAQSQTDNSILEKYCYGDLASNCTEYGGMYQWDETMQYVTTEGAQGICPAGWHVPTDGEISTLTTYLGGESIAGGAMKEAGYAHWEPPNTGATNSSGFTALPGGVKVEAGTFQNLHTNNYLWSSTEYSSSNAWRRGLYFNDIDIGRVNSNKIVGFSIRCLKD